MAAIKRLAFPPLQQPSRAAGVLLLSSRYGILRGEGLRNSLGSCTPKVTRLARGGSRTHLVCVSPFAVGQHERTVRVCLRRDAQSGEARNEVVDDRAVRLRVCCNTKGRCVTRITP